MCLEERERNDEMYERMLDKGKRPSLEEFISYCGDGKELIDDLNVFLTDNMGLEKLLRFPYGNNYGWSIKYSLKNKHICDVFAEKDAFTVMIRLDNSQYETAYNNLLPYTQEFIDNKYPCGNGGWIHYRVLTKEHLEDIKILLQLKANGK